MSSDTKSQLLGKTLIELQAIVEGLGLPRFTAKQICDWLYKKHVTEIGGMTNLSIRAREMLAESYEIGAQESIKVSTSTDGTKKYLFKAPKEGFIEAAFIPDEKRNTLCVSSQVGCKMGCLFCATGKQGFQAQLSAGDIINQVRSIPERDRLTNIVYMGMGEPFDNLEEVMKSLEILTSEWGFAMSPRRITVSTIGILPAMKTFIEESNCHLAVSLHSPFDEERRHLMPIENVFAIKDVVELLKSYDFGRQRRISFEYILFKGINDRPQDVNELARLLNGLGCRINLLRFHSIPDTPLEGSDEATIERFRNSLNDKGIRTTTRQSRGMDIEAACGLLSTKELVKRQADY